MPTTAFNNQVCNAPISISDVGVAPCACSIIEIKIDLSRHTAQTYNVRRSLQGAKERRNYE
jgi:hypothetical protein